MGRPLSSNPGRPRGFTLIELIVVVVLLGIVAGMVVPRLFATRGREVEGAARRAAGLLSAAGQRDALTNQRIAVQYHGGTLRLAVFASVGDAGTAQWQFDPLISEADLEPARLVEATADGVRLEGASWRLEFPQNKPRPTISLLLADADDLYRWRVEMSGRESRATVAPEGRGDRPGAGTVIDLDDLGRGEAAW